MLVGWPGKPPRHPRVPRRTTRSAGEASVQQGALFKQKAPCGSSTSPSQTRRRQWKSHCWRWLAGWRSGRQLGPFEYRVQYTHSVVAGAGCALEQQQAPVASWASGRQLAHCLPPTHSACPPHHQSFCAVSKHPQTLKNNPHLVQSGAAARAQWPPHTEGPTERPCQPGSWPAGEARCVQFALLAANVQPVWQGHQCASLRSCNPPARRAGQLDTGHSA